MSDRSDPIDAGSLVAETWLECRADLNRKEAADKRSGRP
jgi:hypothetical protein